MKISLKTNNDRDFKLFLECFPENEGLSIKESRGSDYALTGEELFRFIYITLASGIIINATYDLLKMYLAKAFKRISELLSSSQHGKAEITINGIPFELKEAADVDAVLDAIIEILDKMNDDER